jgi:DNA polymerase-3 subunit epsilon
MLFSQPCAIVDLETTGGHVTRDRITEIGLLLIDGEHVERLSYLVNPGQPIPPFIENMTGISDAMVADAPSFSRLAPSILPLLEGRLLLAHNVRFDYGVLKNEFKRAGLSFRSEVLCTVKLSRRLYPEHYKHNLDAIIARHHIVLPARHRALADAEGVYRFILSASEELGVEKVLSTAQALIGESAPPAGLDAATYDALPDVAGVYSVFDTTGLPLYVGRASNIRRQVLAHFGCGKQKEVQLAEQAGRIEWQETLGDFGAALLEIMQLKRLHPRLNARGRLRGETCSICLEMHADGFLRPRIVATEQLSFSPAAAHHGLFRTMRDARKALQDLATGACLCQSVLGIERVTSRKGRPCDGRAAGRCPGACIGLETADAHNARLQAAITRLSLQDWPYASAIAIVEQDKVSGEAREYVFDRWRYYGFRTPGKEEELREGGLLDPDLVKLLKTSLRKLPEDVCVRELPPDWAGGGA